jgi:hypothetical protein
MSLEGANLFKSRHLVLINPGVSGLTARQILDRMFSG